MILKLGMDHQGLKVYKVHINYDPDFTLIFFTARSNLLKLFIVLQTNSHVSVYRTNLQDRWSSGFVSLHFMENI